MTVNKVELHTSDSGDRFIGQRDRSGLLAVRLLSRIVAAALAVVMITAAGLALLASL